MKKEITDSTFLYVYKGVATAPLITVTGEEILEGIINEIEPKTEKVSEEDDKDYYVIKEQSEVLIQVGYNVVEIPFGTGDMVCVDYSGNDS